MSTVNEVRINIRVIRDSVTVRVSLVLLVSVNSLVALCIAIWWMKWITLSDVHVRKSGV